MIISCLVVLFVLSGWRALVVKTPSMGQTAPVGSLVLSHTQPDYKIGDIISFWQHEKIYTHRITDVDEDRLITKGDLNHAVDPWRITKADVIGRAESITHHAGWLLVALPWVALGWLIVYLISLWRKIHPNWRWPVRIMGGAVVVTLVSLWLHPWLNFGLLSYVPNNNQGIDLHIVNTGIFPLKAEGERLLAGQDAVVTVPHADEMGRFILTPRPALGFWGVVGALLFCLTPLILACIIRLPRSDLPLDDPRNYPVSRRLWTIVSAIVLIVVVILILQLSTLATFVSAINNSANSVPTRTYFTCRNAVSPSGSPQPFLAYALDNANAGTEPDISGNGRSGAHTAPILASDLQPNFACQRETVKASVYFLGAHCLIANSAPISAGPSVFSLEAWFRTAHRNGKIAGFGNTTGAADSQYDRHIYIDSSGRVVFGVFTWGLQTLASPAGRNYADDQWHHVVATINSSSMNLYLDGQLSAQYVGPLITQPFAGYWKFGCGRLAGWPNGDGSGFAGAADFYTGYLQYVAAYHTALTAQQVKEHYLASKP